MPVSRFLTISSDPDLTGPRIAFHHSLPAAIERGLAIHRDLGRNVFVAEVSQRFVSADRDKPEAASMSIEDGIHTPSGHETGRSFSLSCSAGSKGLSITFQDDEVAAAAHARAMGDARGRQAWCGRVCNSFRHPSPRLSEDAEPAIHDEMDMSL